METNIQQLFRCEGMPDGEQLALDVDERTIAATGILQQRQGETYHQHPIIPGL